jgi:hypothetical protein
MFYDSRCELTFRVTNGFIGHFARSEWLLRSRAASFCALICRPAIAPLLFLYSEISFL